MVAVGSQVPAHVIISLDRTSGILIFFISRDSLSFCHKHKNNNDGFWFAFFACLDFFIMEDTRLYCHCSNGRALTENRTDFCLL